MNVLNDTSFTYARTNCVGVVFNAVLAYDYQVNAYGNCWLKSALANPDYNEASLQISVVLQP